MENIQHGAWLVVNAQGTAAIIPATTATGLADALCQKVRIRSPGACCVTQSASVHSSVTRLGLYLSVL